MNWDKAMVYGLDFVEDLKELMNGDFCESTKEVLVESHIINLKDGGWKEFPSFNDLTAEELADVLEVDLPEEQKTEKINLIVEKLRDSKPLSKGNVPLAPKEERETKKLEFDDYTDLIEFAESIGDTEWRNDLLERECAS